MVQSVGTVTSEVNFYVNWPSEQSLHRGSYNKWARVCRIVTQSFMPQPDERLRDEPKERLGSDATRAATRRARVPYATCKVFVRV